jgi:hypothetical protein
MRCSRTAQGDGNGEIAAAPGRSEINSAQISAHDIRVAADTGDCRKQLGTADAKMSAPCIHAMRIAQIDPRWRIARLEIAHIQLHGTISFGGSHQAPRRHSTLRKLAFARAVPMKHCAICMQERQPFPAESAAATA